MARMSPFYSRLFCLFSLGFAIGCTSSSDSPESHRLHLNTQDKGYLNYPVRILDRAVSEAFAFDPKVDPPAVISYHLTRAGLVRIRICWRADKRLVLRTLVDWTHQEFGAHQIRWDGRDASGNILDNRGSLVTFEAHSPEHRNHASEDCREPLLKIVNPTPGATLGDPQEIQLEITRDTPVGRRDGWELRCYVDYELVSKTFLQPSTRRFSLPSEVDAKEGEHLITVNLDDGAQHVGTISLKADFEDAGTHISPGQIVFEDLGCAECHDVQSSRRTRDKAGLLWIGSRRPESYLRAATADPRSVSRTARMPKVTLNDEELEQVTEFLLSLKRKAIPPRTGREIYEEEGCWDCHDTKTDTGGMMGPYLPGPVAARTTHYLKEVILDPQRFYPMTSMPPTLLSNPELDNLIGYMRELGASCPLPAGN